MHAVLNEGMSIRHASEHHAAPWEMESVEGCYQALLVGQDRS